MFVVEKSNSYFLHKSKQLFRIFFEDESLNYSIADVVTAIDGDKLFNGCGLGLKECSASKPCPIHYEFKEIRDNIKNMLILYDLLCFICFLTLFSQMTVK